MPFDPRDPFEQARRERSLLRGLWELTPLGQAGRLASDYKSFAERERASGSLLGDYLTALEPVEQIGSDLLESGQMVGNAIQAGSGALAGLAMKASPSQFTPAGWGEQNEATNPAVAYERSLAKRLPDRGAEFDPLAIGSYLEAAPGPGDVLAEAAIPDPSSPVERVGKTLGALTGNLILAPENAAVRGLQGAAELASSGRYADAAAQVLGSPVAGAVYAPDIAQTVMQGADVALDPTRSISERIEAGIQGGLATVLGGLVAHGAISERIALKKAAKSQGLDDIPPQALQPPPPSLPQEAPEATLPIREPQPLPEPLYGAPVRSEVQPQRVVEAPKAPAPDIVVDEAVPAADIRQETLPAPIEAEPARPVEPAVEPVQPEPLSTPRGQEPGVDERVPFAFPLDEVAPEVRPSAQQIAERLADQFAESGKLDQAALDAALTDPALSPYSDQIKRHAVLEASALIQGRSFLDDIRGFHGDEGPSGIEIVPAGGAGGGDAGPGASYDIVQRAGGRVIGAAEVRDGVLTMVAGGRKMGSPESVRPVYEALDAAGAKRNDLLTVLGANARRTKIGRDAQLQPGQTQLPSDIGTPGLGPEVRTGVEGRVPEATGARHPLDSDDPLPARQLIDQTRLRLAQHERTRAPEATVAHDLGSAVYHVVASGLKRTLPQVRGWIKRHLGTWLRKVGFSGQKLNSAIASAYEAAKTRWQAHQRRMQEQFGDPQRGSLSSRKVDPASQSQDLQNVLASGLDSPQKFARKGNMAKLAPNVGTVELSDGSRFDVMGQMFAGKPGSDVHTLDGSILSEGVIAKVYDRYGDLVWSRSQQPSKPSAPKSKQPVMSREEIDRQLRTNPELRGMARAQLEAVAQSAGKPMTHINDADLRKAFPGDDPQSRATRAMLNRVAASERAGEVIETGDELTQQLQASLATPTRGPKTLSNPRSQSGKVRADLPDRLKSEARKTFDSHVEPARKAAGNAPILKLDDLDEGVRAALRIKNEADLKRMLGGRELTQDQVAAFKLTVQDQAAKTRGKLYKYRTAKTDKARAEALSEYLDSQLEQAANLRAFAGDNAAAARIEKAKARVGETDAVQKLFASLRPGTRAALTDRQAATLATLMRETIDGRRPPGELGEAIQRATSATPLDKILEWWKAGLLSGPPTHIANFLGNTTNLLLDLAKTGVAGGLDTLASRGRLGSPVKARERYVSDLGASIHGMMGAMGPALRHFSGELANMATLGPEKFDINAGRYEHQVGAIGGTLGRIVRSPFRALGAADGFFRTLLIASEQFKEANRAIERRIEKGDVDRSEKAAFMADHLEKMRDPANAGQFKEVAARIDREVRKGLFQQDADELTRYVQRVLHTPIGKLGQFFVPFVSTPVNILKTTARYTPAGGIAARLRANRLVDAEANATAIDDMAKGIVGTVIGAGLLGLAHSGVITGSGPTDPRERALKEKTGWKPRSLKLDLGDKTFYVPIDRIEPLGTLFGLAGDIVELKDEKKSGDAFTKMVGMLKDNVLEKSYLEGLSNLFELASDPERHGASFLRSFAGSWVPAISGRLAQGLDPIVRDTRGEGDSPMARIADSIRKSMQARVPGLSQQLEARRDPTGAPMERTGNFVTRALVPSAISEEKSGPESEVARELLRISFTPGEPRREMTIQGRKIELNQAEYAKLLEAQQRASAEVARVMKQAAYQSLPDTVEEGGQASKEAVVRRIYDGYRDRARNDLYRTPRLSRERRKSEAQRMPNVRINFQGR